MPPLRSVFLPITPGSIKFSSKGGNLNCFCWSNYQTDILSVLEMTVLYPPAGISPNASPPSTDASLSHSDEGGNSFGRKIVSIFTKTRMSASSSEEHSAWSNISSFFKGLHSRAVKLVNYVSRHLGEMLPPFFTKTGIGSVAGFVIGVLTPVGPLWGTVGGLLIATGWQLGVEYNTDRDKPDLTNLKSSQP
ncbi:hypothetical protein [Endozoicomonas sp. GU-1]|uniref:hypothetical protein n=1 Tax=Endozoicomonas sp. GU-1 TaxID=3009078 RepID=UPI0022B3E7FA|nr:hypothetical protein [Endozoicomonas sp. GU-1]WBA82750.1 hypothetical protein O2T12_06360 [Endozoicomonas sp. GU-1]WBA85681.1 hypothetical protein O3276_21005 [Endozoicomonas sp. GU-1]